MPEAVHFWFQKHAFFILNDEIIGSNSPALNSKCLFFKGRGGGESLNDWINPELPSPRKLNSGAISYLASPDALFERDASLRELLSGRAEHGSAE